MESTKHNPDAPQKVLEEVLSEYDKTLNIPENKMIPQWILMPVGYIGSGKTTTVKILSDYFGLIVVSNDEIRRLLLKRGYSYEGAREIAGKVITKYLTEGYSIAVDSNTGSEFGIRHSQEVQKDFPTIKMQYIHIDPPEDFIITHLRNTNKTWLFENGDEAVKRYFINKERVGTPAIKYVYTFDPSKGDFDIQIKESILAIKKALDIVPT